MKERRFYASRSSVYGYCVYDRNGNVPAYDACDQLPREVAPDGITEMSPACTLLDSMVTACRLSATLNSWYQRGLIQ